MALPFAMIGLASWGVSFLALAYLAMLPPRAGKGCEAPISVGFRSFRLIFRRAIISRDGLEREPFSLERARARNTHVEATSNRPFPAQAFGVPLDAVHVDDTASDKVANSAATAASMSTDLYGMAALDACHQILKRLEPVKARRAASGEALDLASVAGDAFFNRVDLSAHGFYAVDTKRCGYDWTLPSGPGRGMPFNYWTQGAAVAEVEVDALTGDFEIVRADVLVDLGCSINPALDVGQIEGAFVQGAGWLTSEELIVAETGNATNPQHAWFRAPAGTLLTNGPGNYKLPSFNDAPRDFRVELLDRADNVHCVHSSKAVGEPPFFLGSAVLFALQHAVAAKRKDRGLDDFLCLRAPATPEKLRMHCRDAIADTAVEKLGRDPATWQASATY